MSVLAVTKAINLLVEETTVSTIDKLVVYLSDKIEFDDDMKKLFDDFKKTTKEELKASQKQEKGKRGGKKVENKKKREPSAYNLFIKEKMAEIKQKKPELKGKELMKEAIEEWKKTPKKE